LRVLHAYKVFGPDIEGGIPAVISSLTRNTIARHSVLTARLSGTGSNYTLNGTSVEAVSSFGNLFSTPVAPHYIPAFCRSARFADIVIHHAPFPLTDAAILIGLPERVALIVYWHADVSSYPLLKRAVNPLMRRVLARADRIVVSGRSMIEQCALLKVHASKCAVLPYGVDLNYWRTLSAEELAATDQARQRYPRHIAAVGRLVPYKGLDVLVRAMRDVDAHLSIAGNGPLLANLQRLAAGLNIAHRISFTGRIERSEIKTLLHSSNILALPSVTSAEAFGLVQIEAMAVGLPIVNTRLPTTVPEVARHNQEGITVPPNDPQALAEALNKLLAQPSLAQRFGMAARIRAEAEYSEKAFGTRMDAVYLDAIRNRSEPTIRIDATC
jgi:glycosyltransferase involved in cell wall biosynthesis